MHLENKNYKAVLFVKFQDGQVIKVNCRKFIKDME